MTLSVFDAAARSPATPAIVTEDGVLDYGALAERVRHAVGWLRRSGQAEAPISALLAYPTLDTLEMVHAHIALGLPVLLIHPRLTPEERQVALQEAGSPPLVPSSWREHPDARPESRAIDGVPDDDRPLAVLQTSGTTGRPRLVVLSRQAFAAAAAASAANLGWHDDDRWLLRLPVAHVGGLSVATRCLLATRTVVLGGDGSTSDLLRTIRRHRVTILSLVPTLLARLLNADPPAVLPTHVRAILLGGAAASPTLLQRAADRGWPVLTTYGLTETCSQVATQPVGTINRGDLGAGPPLPGIGVQVAADGQIMVRGPTLLTGYLTPRGIAPPRLEDGWLPTGDQGRLDASGNLHVTGRRADRIVTGGENVDPVEVEQVLEQAKGVRRACVFSEPDPEWGELVCAAVVGEPDLDLPTLRAHVDRALAPFKRPRRIALLRDLPLGGTGKMDRTAVARLARPELRPF